MRIIDECMYGIRERKDLARHAALCDQNICMTVLNRRSCPRTAGKRISDASEFAIRPRGCDGGSIEGGFSHILTATLRRNWEKVNRFIGVVI
jgi:hypothetical protein